MKSGQSSSITVKQVEFFDSRYYKITTADGVSRFVPSVTTKLGILDKPFLTRWRGDIGNREADMRMFQAQERGSRIHHAWDVLQRGGLIIYQPWQMPNYTDQEIGEMKAKNVLWTVVEYQDEMLDLIKLKRFLDVVKPFIVSTETTVYSLEDNDAGTLDGLYRIEEGDYLINGAKPLHLPGGVYVADLKTGKLVDKSAYRQTAAYVNCVKKMGIADPIGTLILHTDSGNKKGIEGLGVHLRMGDDLVRDLEDYRIISTMWEREHRDDTPKVFEFPSLLKLS